MFSSFLDSFILMNWIMIFIFTIMIIGCVLPSVSSGSGSMYYAL